MGHTLGSLLIALARCDIEVLDPKIFLKLFGAEGPPLARFQMLVMRTMVMLMSMSMRVVVMLSFLTELLLKSIKAHIF